MPEFRTETTIDALRSAAVELDPDRGAEEIVAHIGEAEIVLLGEATHGTHEFYQLRADITRTLIEQRGFAAVAIEGDWPDAYRVNRYVQGGTEATDAGEALAGFVRFPTWMWRNTVVAEFVSWLRAHNESTVARPRRVGFYGLDLYSLHASMRAVVDYLQQQDPAAAEAARRSYACFEDFGRDTDQYAWSAGRLGGETCAEAVARELVRLRERRTALLHHDSGARADEFFYAEQNARLAQNAELYYRTMVRGHIASWNVRDQHMAETLDALLDHLAARGQPRKVVVWAHNSHLGDARATEMGRGGELNLGQLVRERHGSSAALLGFTTHHGTVMAAEDWDRPGRVRTVRPALPDSYEDVFHRTGVPAFYLPLAQAEALHAPFNQPRLERAIGVIYRPETERWSHYFQARLAAQFDGVVHIDATRAVEPLEPVHPWVENEVPETYPSGV
jgi:erythromycin esterase-like protein